MNFRGASITVPSPIHALHSPSKLRRRSWKGGGGQNESCWPKVVLLKGEREGGRDEEETRTEIFFFPKGGKGAVDTGYLGPRRRASPLFVSKLPRCVRACVRAKRALFCGRPLNRFPPFRGIVGREGGRRDEWEMTKERETQLGINEISGDGH